MPYLRREWVAPRCLRCDAEVDWSPAKRGRGPKWCDECRPYARVGNAIRSALRAIAECPGSREIDEVRVELEEMRERLNVGEDLFPLDGGMSTAEFLPGAGRDAWRELRTSIEAARREVSTG